MTLPTKPSTNATPYPPLLTPFKNKIAVVLGGFSGIGWATANLLYQQGAKVIVLGLVPLKEGLTRETKEASLFIDGRIAALKACCPNEVDPVYPRYAPDFLECDVTSTSEDGKSLIISDFLDAIGHRHGRIDCLVDSIGYSPRMPLCNLSPNIMAKTFEANCGYIPIAYSAAAPYMQGSGNIVVVGSTLPHGPTDTTAIAYAAAKASRAVTALGLSREFGTKGINICVVSPSHVPTENERKILGPARAEATRLEAMKKRPNGKDLTSEDVARFILTYLTPDVAALASGTEILVGGGGKYQALQRLVARYREALAQNSKRENVERRLHLVEGSVRALQKQNKALRDQNEKILALITDMPSMIQMAMTEIFRRAGDAASAPHNVEVEGPPMARPDVHNKPGKIHLLHPQGGSLQDGP